MNGIAYYRVSTPGQGRSGLGLEAQRTSVEALAVARKLEILAEFTEVESGRNNDRPQLAKALERAKLTGSVLLIAKLDRLSRNAAFLLTMRDSGVRFIAADIPDANDLTIGVLAVIAQAEREAISKRTTEALAAVKARIAVEGRHVSGRTGRTITRLGNPRGAAALRDSGRGNSAGVEAAKAAATNFAESLRPTIDELRTLGYRTPGELAAELNARKIVTWRGGRWHRSTIGNLVAAQQTERP